MRLPSIALTSLFVVLLRAALAPAAEAPAGDAKPSDADLQFFEAKIRPVLVDRCYQCHSAQAKKEKGGLLVDGRSALLKGGENGPAIVPGAPEKSKLIEAVGYHNVDLQMPPKGKLTDAQVADLTEWVKRGAPWPAEQGAAVAKSAGFDVQKLKAEHWAWQPVSKPQPPAVKDAAWPVDPIDRFVLAKLEEKGLKPAGQAQKRALIRRATFAVTGLPPTPEEVEGFVADASPDAFAKVVDRLLASPAYGERWGRHWLDLARYAETRGHEFDGLIPDAWRYRDYVIRAFNADVPYDQFVKEHVAGDLLPKPRLDDKGVANESVLATGFWFLGEWVHSPVDIRQDECDRVDNQVDVFGKTFLGLTVACARCHDHKFDAITAKDYYALVGFLHSSSYRDVRFEHQAHNAAVAERLRKYDDEAGRKVIAAMNVAAKPVTERLDAYLLAAGRALAGEKVNAAADGLDAAVLSAWVAELKRAAKDESDPVAPLGAAVLGPRADHGTLEVVTRWRKDDSNWQTIVDYAVAKPGQWIADGNAFGDGPRAAWSLTPGASAEQPFAAVADGAAAVGTAATKSGGLLRTPTFTITSPTLSMLVSGSGQAFVCIDSHRMVAGPLHGVSKQAIKAGDRRRVQTVDLSNYVGQRAHVEFTSEAGGRLEVRWLKQGTGPAPAGSPSPLLRGRSLGGPVTFADLSGDYAKMFRRSWSALLLDRDGRNAVVCDPVFAEWLLRRPVLLGLAPGGKAAPAVAAAWSEYDAGRKKILAEARPSATAMAIMDGSPVDERVLIRGSPKTPGEAVPRRFLSAIDGPEPIKVTRGSGRLELAERLVDPANPLVSRVYVNRVWHHLFGRGIVGSTDNFGVLGEKPTHPELLDHLASTFVADGWSTRRLIRRVLLSRTWQMESHPSDAATEQLDPQNLLLHRQNLRRLEAEAIRDGILAISGRLDPAVGGPSVEVYLTSFMDGRGRPGGSGPLDGAGRRSVYTRLRRNFLPPMMLAFDMPQPFNAMGRRSVSNVPAQALILMNDPFVVAQAKLWAKRVADDKTLATPDQRIDRMYRQAFARPPTADEVAAALGFLDEQGAQREVPEAKRRDDARGWDDLAHVLMNVKEFVYVP